MRTLAFIFLTLCLGSWAPHPLKMSTCTLTPIGNTLHVKVRLFTDDFTAHMESLSKQRKLNFEKPGTQEMKAVRSYFKEHFSLKCQGTLLPYQLTKVATEEYNLVVAVSLSTPIANCQDLVLKNTLMMDAFDNQKNMVIYKGATAQTFEYTAAKQVDTLRLR